MEKKEKREQTNEPKKGTSKTTLIAAVAVIVLIVGYYGVLYLPDILAAPKYEDNPKTFVHTSYGEIDKSIATPVDTRGYERKDVLEFFEDVALFNELSGIGHPATKRVSPVSLYILGSPSSEDISTLSYVIESLNKIPGFPGISITDNENSANSFIHFYAGEEYSKWERSRGIIGSKGVAIMSQMEGSCILETLIGINCDSEQHKRSSVIMEEVIQSMGLYNDSWKYTDSIFYQGGTDVDAPLDLDWLLVELLYHPAVRLNAGRSECLYTLRNLLVQ